MTRYGIDAPTLLQVLDRGGRLDPAHQLVAPNCLRSDALQLLLDDVRRGARSEQAALDRHTELTEVKVRLLGDRVSRQVAWKLAREHDWPTLHDAEHLAVTRLQADALVTVDADLRERAAGIVAVAAVDDLLASR